MKYSKIRVQDEPAILEWWKRKLKEDDEIRVISMSDTLPNRGTKRYYHFFADIALAEEHGNEIEADTETEVQRNG